MMAQDTRKKIELLYSLFLAVAAASGIWGSLVTLSWANQFSQTHVEEIPRVVWQ
jgi:hypothetical protein